MDDVRLTPAERRALEQIEAELRKDRDLDRALRRMRLPRGGRRHRHGEPEEPSGPQDEGRAGLEGHEGHGRGGDGRAGKRRRNARDAEHGDAYRDAGAAEASDADGKLIPEPNEHHDRRRAWALALVLSVVFVALLSAGTVFFLVFALVAVTLAASAGVVWMCVSFYMRRPDTG